MTMQYFVIFIFGSFIVNFKQHKIFIFGEGMSQLSSFNCNTVTVLLYVSVTWMQLWNKSQSSLHVPLCCVKCNIPTSFLKSHWLSKFVWKVNETSWEICVASNTLLTSHCCLICLAWTLTLHIFFYLHNIAFMLNQGVDYMLYKLKAVKSIFISAKRLVLTICQYRWLLSRHILYFYGCYLTIQRRFD